MRMGLFFYLPSSSPTRCSCPTNSCRDLDRIVAAKGCVQAIVLPMPLFQSRIVQAVISFLYTDVSVYKKLIASGPINIPIGPINAIPPRTLSSTKSG